MQKEQEDISFQIEDRFFFKSVVRQDTVAKEKGTVARQDTVAKSDFYRSF